MTKAECIAYVERHMEVRYATKNGAYRAGRDIACSGSVDHSIGCAQPNAEVIYSLMNKESAGWGVSFILGDFHKGEGRIIQCLPFNEGKRTTRRNWGVGSGKKGSWNNSRVQFECCEPAGHTYAGGTMIGYDVTGNQAYFERFWKMLVAFNVYLAVKLGFDADHINDHAESYRAGMGGNHADLGQWLPKHGKSMDCLRAEVKAILDGKESEGDDMKKEDVEAIVAEAIRAEQAKGEYATIADVPKSYRPSLQKLMDAGVLAGYDGGKDQDVTTLGDNTIRVDETFCRIITVLDRAGLLNL